MEHTAAAREIHSILAKGEFVPLGSGFTAAHSAVLEPCGGPRWVAAGDAAMSFDPLSSQGLFHALFSGLVAAEAAHAYLAGDHNTLHRYRQLMRSIEHVYRLRLDFSYASETRWPSSPFWNRRRGMKLSTSARVTSGIADSVSRQAQT